MNPDQRQKLLAMARHEFSLYSVSQLKEEYQRKIMLDEYCLFGYNVAKDELKTVFEDLIKERRSETRTPKVL